MCDAHALCAVAQWCSGTMRREQEGGGGLESGATCLWGFPHHQSPRTGWYPLGALDICIASPLLEAWGAFPAEFHPAQHVACRRIPAPGEQSARRHRRKRAEVIATPLGAPFSREKPADARS